MLTADQQLQQESGAVDHLSPAAFVIRFPDPCFPEVRGFPEPQIEELHLRWLPLAQYFAEDEGCRFARLQAELSNHTLGLLFHRDAGVQRHWRTQITCREKCSAPISDLDAVTRPRIIEPRLTMHFEVHRAADYRYPSDNFVWLLDSHSNRHVVGQLRYTFVGKKSSQQDVSVRQVELAYAHFHELRLNLKPAATLIIEEAGENGRRIEIRITKKIDRTVDANQRNRPHIADYAVVFNGLKAHRGMTSVACRSRWLPIAATILLALVNFQPGEK